MEYIAVLFLLFFPTCVIVVFALQHLWWNFAAASFQAFRLPQPTSGEGCFWSLSLLLPDPFLAYQKTDLVKRLRQAMARQVELETQYVTVLQDVVQRDVRIAELEAELVHYREYFERWHMTGKPQEHLS